MPLPLSIEEFRLLRVLQNSQALLAANHYLASDRAECLKQIQHEIDAIQNKPGFARAVAGELVQARAKHAKHVCAHQSLAVILEEFEELKAEVFKKNKNPVEMMKELIQLATCCQRMAEDVVEPMFPKANEHKSDLSLTALAS